MQDTPPHSFIRICAGLHNASGTHPQKIKNTRRTNWEEQHPNEELFLVLVLLFCAATRKAQEKNTHTIKSGRAGFASGEYHVVERL